MSESSNPKAPKAPEAVAAQDAEQSLVDNAAARAESQSEPEAVDEKPAKTSTKKASDNK